MRSYGKVYSSFWANDDMRSLSEDGRMLALYLMTSPHGNMVGCFLLPDAYAAHDLKWTIERVTEGFKELFTKSFAYRCERTFWVFIRGHCKWNQFENPNVAKAAAKLFDSLSAPANIKAFLVNALRENCRFFPADVFAKFDKQATPFENPFETLSKPVAVAVTPAVVEAEAEATAYPIVGQKPDVVQSIFAYWQERMNSSRSVLDDKRRGLIVKALKSYTPAEICKAIRGCSKTPHNMGINAQKTKYNGIGLILRDAENIERFIANDAGNARASVGAESIEEKNIRIMTELLVDSSADHNTFEMAA
jgi:hypothetical protein